MVKQRCTFKYLEENLKKPGRHSKNSKNLEEIQKICRKFPKNLWQPCIHLLNDYKSQVNKIQVDMYTNYDVTAKKQSQQKYSHSKKKKVTAFMSLVLC